MAEDDKLAMFAASAFQAILIREWLTDAITGKPEVRTGREYTEYAQEAWVRAKTLQDSNPYQGQ